MTPQTWREMVDRTRELEFALGSGVKDIADNEHQTVVVQRRCLRAAADLPAGHTITRDDLDVLRPAPLDAVFPYEIDAVVGRTLSAALPQGEYLRWPMLSAEPVEAA